MKKLLIRTFSSDEYSDANFEYALVILDDEAMKAIADKMSLVETWRAANPDLVEVSFRDTLCTFHEGAPFWNSEGDLNVDKKTRKHFEDFGWCFLPDGFPMPGRVGPEENSVDAADDSDAIYLVVGTTYFHWHALLCHLSITIDSESLDKDVLAAAAAAQQRHGPRSRARR